MKWLFTILVSIVSFLAVAQNYSGQYPGAMHFYSVNGSNQLTSIREDSSSINGNVLTRFPELLMRDVMNENIIDTNCIFWGGSQCLYKKDYPSLLGNRIVNNDNSIKYFNFFGDSLTVDFSVSIGNTQTVFKDGDTNLLVKYFCFKKDTATIFGVADSVILFTVITTDSLSNLIASALSGDTIIYSKNTGLLNGFSFDFFPNSYFSIELKGIRNPNYGFYGLTYADVYNYQIGDKYEIYHVGQSSYTFTRKLYEVLNRTDGVNDVSYDFKLITWNYTNYPPTTYSESTTFPSATYSKIDFIDENREGSSYSLNTQILSACKNEASLYYSIYQWCGSSYCPSANCYGGSDCYLDWNYTGQFVANTGQTSQVDSQLGWPSIAYQMGMIYFNINGIECGSSHILSTSEIQNNFNLSLFPNPTSNFVTLQTDQIIQNGKIQLTDLSGRVVQQFNFDQSLQIDLSHFSNGVYLVKLFGDGNLLSVQKLVKE